MPWGGGSEAEVKQRQDAPTKHGAFRKDLMIPEGGLDSRPEVVEALKQRVARAIQLTDILTNHVAKQVQAGISLDHIAALKALVSFQNSAMRGLVALHGMLPDGDIVDISEVLESYREDRGEDASHS